VGAAGDLGERRWRILASAMVSFFAVGVTFFAVPPLMPALRSAFALTNLQLGALMGAIAVPAIVLSVPLGAALDSWPPRQAGLGGLWIMLAGAAAFALAPGYWALFAGRLLFGIGALLVNLLLARVLSAAFVGKELALAMALFTGVYPASMIALFSLHPWLEATLGWRGELALLAALVAVAIPLHSRVIPEALAARGGGAEAPPEGPVIPGALVVLGVAWMLYFAAFAPVPTFAPEWAGGGSGGLLVASLITWVALAATPVAGALIDRSGRPQTWCAGGTALLAATLAAMAAGVLPPWLAMALVGLVAATVPPAVYALPARLVGAGRVGLAFGFITALSNLGTVVGPAAAGAVRDATPSWPPVWAGLAAAAAAGAAAALLVRPAKRSVTPGS
jgi:predicted MFS family arabinose efflux permease